MRDHSNQMVPNTLQTFTIDQHTYFAYGRFEDTLITFLLVHAHLDFTVLKPILRHIVRALYYLHSIVEIIHGNLNSGRRIFLAYFGQ
ncbi:hypothetical protein LINPERPRIM_LOCUS19821, partial [Linum perenne]